MPDGASMTLVFALSFPLGGIGFVGSLRREGYV